MKLMMGKLYSEKGSKVHRVEKEVLTLQRVMAKSKPTETLGSWELNLGANLTIRWGDSNHHGRPPEPQGKANS